MKMIKGGVRYLAVFLLTVLLLTGMLVAAASIPQSAIKENVQKSAEYLCKKEVFSYVIPGIEGSKIDRYADSIILAITYQYDDKKPLTSVMWSSYYHTDYQNENHNLFDAVTKNLGANQQYLRYWHGSAAFLRPLLTMFSIQQIYVLNGVILFLLATWLFILLLKRKAWVPIVSMIIGLILTSSWFVPLSLEYTWTYMLMFLMAIVGLKLVFAKKWKYMGISFLVAGIITNYMDFLTTETLTLFVPLLLIIWIKINENSDYHFKKIVKNIGQWILAWGVGYIGMWLMKWGIASLVLKQNVMPYVSEHMIERVTGDVGLKKGEYLVETILRNVKCLLPFEYGRAGICLGTMLLLFIICIVYIYHKQQISKKNILIYGAIGLFPLVRYLVLMNHSYIHYFFTYRALLTTILAIAMLLCEVLEWRWLPHADIKKRKP